MDNREIKLSDFISVAIKRILILILAAIVGMGAALYYSLYMVTPQYKVQSKYYIDLGILSEGVDEVNQLEAQRQVVGARYQLGSYVEILDTDDFAEIVAKELVEKGYPIVGKYNYAQIHNMISFNYELESETFEVAITANHPQDALSIARCVENSAQDYLYEIKKVSEDTLRVIDKARANANPININPVVNMFIGSVFCVAIAFVICFIVEMNDVRIKSERGVMEILGILVIGAIPEYSHGSAGKKSSNGGN